MVVLKGNRARRLQRYSSSHQIYTCSRRSRRGSSNVQISSRCATSNRSYSTENVFRIVNTFLSRSHIASYPFSIGSQNKRSVVARSQLCPLPYEGRTRLSRRPFLRKTVDNAKGVRADFPAGEPEFEHPFARYDLPRFVELEIAIGDDANLCRDRVFTRPMFDAGRCVEQAGIRKSGDDPNIDSRAARRTFDDVPKTEPERPAGWYDVGALDQ